MCRQVSNPDRSRGVDLHDYLSYILKDSSMCPRHGKRKDCWVGFEPTLLRLVRMNVYESQNIMHWQLNHIRSVICQRKTNWIFRPRLPQRRHLVQKQNQSHELHSVGTPRRCPLPKELSGEQTLVWCISEAYWMHLRKAMNSSKCMTACSRKSLWRACVISGLV
jgi:hypothetical protein